MESQFKPKFIISGAPASGKGTQCEFIKEKYKVVHLSTGDMLRAAVAAESEIGLTAKEYMDKGELVPDEVIIGVVVDRLNQADCKENGWLLDGFPRTRAQADALSDAGIVCDVFIQLDVDDHMLVERVVGRRMDPVTGKIYHLKYSPPPADDEELMNRLVHRSDDTEEKIVVRIENYKNNLSSIIDKYATSMVRINGNSTPMAAWKDILSQVELQFRLSNATKPRNPPRFIISGAPASGKGTQCEFIKREFNVVHLSTGDMLRAAVEAQTPIGLEAKSFMDKGALVPDEIIIGVVIDRLDQADCKERGWLLDGFPRTRGQADALERAGIECDIFVQLDVDESVLVERVIGRRMDPETGKIYHLKYSPPPNDIVSRLIHRSDDTEEKVKVRVQNYQLNLDSIIDKYANKVIRIDGNRSPNLIWKEIRSRSIRLLKFHVVFILGGPGSGKGTLCDRIHKEFNYVHLSAGDLLREEVKKGGEFANLIQSIQLKGELVPADLVVRLLSNAMNTEWNLNGRDKFLIDGFPRNAENASVWFQKMSSETIIDMVITLDCSEEVMKERILNRGKTSGRADDNEETLLKRFVTFRKDTEPILKSFDRMGKLRRVDASLPPQAVFKQASAFLRAIDILPLYQRTFAIIQPESVSNNRVPDILKAIADENISIVAKKFVSFTADAVDQVIIPFASPSHAQRISKNLQTGTSLIMILEGTDVIRVWKDLMGPSNPMDAKLSHPKSLRALYGNDEIRNSVYGSENEGQAMIAFDYWFDPSNHISQSMNNQPQTEHSKSPKNHDVNLSYGGLPLEDTFAMIKPLSSQINYDEIKAIIAGHGFEIVSEINTKLSLQVAHQFYNEHVGKNFFEKLTGYMSSGPIVGLHLRRPSAISAWRYLIGPTNVEKAKNERFDSIRAMFAFDGTRNAVHGSDSQASASRELGFFFSIGTFHSPPVAPIPDANIGVTVNPITSIASVPVPVNASNKLSPIVSQSKKTKGPGISRNDISKMQAYASEELNPIMISLVRNLVVARPKQVEDVAISKLTDIKSQRLNGSIVLDSIPSIQEQNSLFEEIQNGSALEEDSVI